jgi:hypothetical protein
MGHPGEDELGEEVLLVGGHLLGGRKRPGRTQIPDDAQLHGAPPGSGIPDIRHLTWQLFKDPGFPRRIIWGCLRSGKPPPIRNVASVKESRPYLNSRVLHHEKAQRLRAAAGGLVGVCHDVEVWLRYCGKPVPFGDSGFTDECVLAAGHGGGCSADVSPSALEVARRGADALAEVSTELADVLGWLVHDPERLGEPSVLENLGRRYWKLSRDVDRLSSLLSALRTAKDTPAADVLLDGGGEGDDEEDELVCTACEFEAESIEQLAEHLQEEGH